MKFILLLLVLCCTSIFGQFLSHSYINTTSLKKTLKGIWPKLGREVVFMDREIEKCLLKQRNPTYSSYIRIVTLCGFKMKLYCMDKYQQIPCSHNHTSMSAILCRRFKFSLRDIYAFISTADVKNKTTSSKLKQVNCIWWMHAPRGFYLEVFFPTFNIPSNYGFCTHKLTLGEDRIICGTNPPFVIYFKGEWLKFHYFTSGLLNVSHHLPHVEVTIHAHIIETLPFILA